ncbi:MAG TPA: hypothetical protein PKZ75_13075 [Bacteroidia bacterium]|jgi:hypothetical protein|nr:hypothetical protein [Bacteroidia bacterium]
MKLIERLFGPVTKGIQNAITIVAIAFLIGVGTFIYFKTKQAIQGVKTEITHNHKDYKSLAHSDSLKTDSLKVFKFNLSEKEIQVQNLNTKIIEDSILNKSLIGQLQKQNLFLNKLNKQYEAQMPCRTKVITKKVFGKDVIEIKVIPCDSL